MSQSYPVTSKPISGNIVIPNTAETRQLIALMNQQNTTITVVDQNMMTGLKRKRPFPEQPEAVIPTKKTRYN